MKSVVVRATAANMLMAALAALVPATALAQQIAFIDSRITSSDICNTERTSNITFIHARWQFGEIRNNSPSDKIPVSCPITTLYLADAYNIGFVVYNNGNETQTVTCTLTEWDLGGAKAQVLSSSVDLDAGFLDLLAFEDVELNDDLNRVHARCVLPPSTSMGLHFSDSIFYE